jgi:hypothetical protein
MFAVGRGASIAQRCYQDALHEIYAFLSLRELLPAAHSCRAWYAAAGKEKGRGLTCRRSRYDCLQQLCSSPLRRHVVGLDYGFLLSPRHLQQLAFHLPHLQSLRASVDESALRPLVNSAAACLTFVQSGFPLHLRCLVLQMALSVETCQLVLNSLPTAAALTKLKLNLVMKWSRRLVLVPLLRLPLLAELSINIESAALTPCHLAVIKQIRALRWLDLHRGGWRRDARLLASLCRQPHALQQLQGIHLRATVVNAAMLAELAHLPSLCKLEPLCLLPCAYPLLPRLSQLRVLRVRLNSDLAGAPLAAAATYPTLAERSTLCASLSACRLLTELTVEACKDADLLASFLPWLLQSTPALRCLRLETVSVRSISFLGATPQLEELHLQECRPQLAAAEVLGIRMPHLQTLHLVHAAVMSDTQLAALCPPSTLFPSLRSCRYR